MTTKRPSLKERAFEKLGFGQRFRSNTESSTDQEDEHSKTTWYTPSMDSQYDTRSDTEVIDSLGGGNSEPVTTTDNSNSETTQTNITVSQTVDKKPKKTKPDGTEEYTVKDTDTIESIAAFFDTTPSELKKINRLTSRLIFPGQVLYVPLPQEETQEVTEELSPLIKTSPPDLIDHRPCMDIPLVKMADKPPAKVPGHIERQTSATSPSHESAFESPHRLSDEEAKQLDQECYERFIKVRVKHITDGQGVVSGVLLVTPNAVMFDPNVSDPLVLEHGAERYGVIAPMDMIVSAAMYHDIAAMNIHNGKAGENSKDMPKPEIYHDKTCPLYKSWVEGHAELMQMDPETYLSNVTPSRSGTINSEMSETASLCSCGAGLDSSNQTGTGLSPAYQSGAGVSPVSQGGADLSPANQRKSPGMHSKVDDDDVLLLDLEEEKDQSNISQDIKTSNDSMNILNDKDSPLDVGKFRSPSMDEFGDFQSAETFQGDKVGSEHCKDKQLSNAEKEGADSDYANSVTMDTSKNAEISADTSLPKHESSEGNSSELELLTSVEKERTTFYLENTVAVERVLSSGSGQAVGEAESTLEQIGNIVYLPVSESNQGEVSVQEVENARDRLSRISVDQFEQTEKSSDPIDVPNGNDKVSSADARLSGSSFGSFNMAPHLSAFVNYATGLFKTNADVKDISEVIPNEESHKEGSGVTPESDKSGTKLTGKSGLEVENAIKLTDKPELFQSFDDLIPKPAATFDDLPLYLCLRLGMPINREISQTCPIQAYGKGRKKPEYWFSIPRDKVDHLYAFFVQWTPQIYGGEDDIAEKRGFVVLDDVENADEDKLEIMDEYFSNGILQKDWEIISADEAINRRKSMCEVETLPEVIGQSKIMEEKHIYMLNRVLPPRTIGYPWMMIYSTEQHGFSLRTLYRDMQGIDSPILLVVRDTSDNIFGALTSCALKMSDHFYGTGESFMYTFYPEFKVFHWTGENDFFLKGNAESLFIGAGQGNFGLWFDGDIYHGRTQHCETYDNDLLTSSEDFVVKTLEAWAFYSD